MRQVYSQYANEDRQRTHTWCMIIWMCKWCLPMCVRTYYYISIPWRRSGQCQYWLWSHPW